MNTQTINLAETSTPTPLTLVKIPAGQFLMGSPEQEDESHAEDMPQHLVKLESFFMGQTPITQAQWREVAGWKEREGEKWGRELKPNPSRFQQPGDARLFEKESSTDGRPVECVSWEEAMEFCSRLSQRTGRMYTLPSEAQWEYACRAGTTTPFAFGETLTDELANYDGNYTYGKDPKGAYREQTTPVGMFPANGWGLQDMHGNVWEWCLDQWHGTYEGAPEDGSAWLAEEGGNRLLRGGSWHNGPVHCRSASRNFHRPAYACDNFGFRVACLPRVLPSTLDSAMTSPQQEQLSELCLNFQDVATALGNAFKPLAEQLPYIVKALKALQGMTEELDPQEPEWWPLHISADGGGFGRFRWFNGSDEFWGECWWDSDLP